jgi:hypothetical protein
MTDAKNHYQPRTGSLPYQVIEFFRANPEEELTRSDIAQKFGTEPKSVDGALAGAMAAQVIVKRNSADLGLVIFVAGPNINKQAAAPYAEGKAKPTSKTDHRTRLPRVDLGKVAVRYGVPLPPINDSRKGSNRYGDLLAQLDQDGASVVLPIMYRAAVQKACAKYLKDNQITAFKFLVRTIDVGTCGVWRTK